MKSVDKKLFDQTVKKNNNKGYEKGSIYIKKKNSSNKAS